MESLVVYGLPNCVQCEQVKKFLNRMLVEFEYVDLSSDSAAYEYVRALGFTQAPVVVIGDESFSGFNPDKLNSIISKFGLNDTF